MTEQQAERGLADPSFTEALVGMRDGLERLERAALDLAAADEAAPPGD